MPELLTRRGLLAQIAVGLAMIAQEQIGQNIIAWVTQAVVLEDGVAR